MFKADFVTFCHWRDWERLSAPGELKRKIDSHRYSFGDVIVVKQNLRSVLESARATFPEATKVVETEDYYPQIFAKYNIQQPNPVADEWTHGSTAPHFWENHVVNHLVGLEVSAADYVVFADSDCYIKSSPPGKSWVQAGMEVLSRLREVLIVGPSDGGTMAERRANVLGVGPLRLTQNVSQQMFICERERLKRIDFDVPWNWEKLAPGGPFQEFYYLLEGRIWRYMDRNGLYRAILPDQFRYWHDMWH